MWRYSNNLSLFFLLSFLSLIHFCPPIHAHKKLNKLNIVSGDTFIPLSFMDSEGNPSGIIVDLMKQWGKKTDVAVTFTLMNWKDALGALLNNEADVIFGVSKTADREKYLTFSIPVGSHETIIYFHNKLSGIRKLDDLKGFQVGVLSGTDWLENIDRKQLDFTLLEYVNYKDLINDALKGKLKVFIGDNYVIPYFLTKHDHGNTFKKSLIPLSKSEIHFAALKEKKYLITIINEGLKSISHTERKNIVQKWLGQDVSSITFPWHILLIGSFVIIILILLLLGWNAFLQQRVSKTMVNLSESEERYRSLIQTSPLAIIVHANEEVVFCNKKAQEILKAKDENELLGKNILTFVHEESMDFSKQRVNQVYFQKETAPLMHEKFLRLDGTAFDVEAVSTPTSYMGRPASQLVFNDITERKSLESQLRQSQKLEAIGQLAGGVAHDFNNIIQAIQGYTDISMARLKPDSNVYPKLTEIRKATEKASALTRQLLTFGRRQPSQPKLLYLRDVIDDISTMLQRIIKEHVHLDANINAKCHPIFADPSEIQQVIMNLCINSRDAMPNGGTIMVTTSNFTITEDALKCYPQAKLGQYVLLSVADNGNGIDPEIRARIFDPFFTTKEVGEGTGLGLSTVYAIVKRLNGFIDVESEINVGTTFKIFIPRAPQGNLPTKDHKKSIAIMRGFETILLAEDDSLVRNMTIEILENAGYHLLVAQNGKEALDLVHTHKSNIHIAVLDVVMPVLGGWDLYKKIRIENLDFPILFTTGYSDDVFSEGPALDTQTQLIQKPYAPLELLIAIRNLLSPDNKLHHD